MQIEILPSQQAEGKLIFHYSLKFQLNQSLRIRLSKISQENKALSPENHPLVKAKELHLQAQQSRTVMAQLID